MQMYRRVCAFFMLLTAVAGANQALAGGWDRFDQGVDLLFDPGNLVFDVDLFDLVPDRKFNTVDGRPEIVNTVPNIFRPSVNAKFTPFDNAACLAAYRQPFGLNNDYGAKWSQAAKIVSQELDSNELSLTCSYRFSAGPGYIRMIGGVAEDFTNYHQEAVRTLPNGSVLHPALDLDAAATGWRGGLAYEIPSNAFRASLVYYSNLNFSTKGTLRQLPLGGNAFLGAVPVTADTPSPRAVEAVVQSAIAPAWLDSVSVKWVNWSALTSIPVILNANVGPLRAGRVLSSLNVFFRDGWTISNTVTYRWSDSLALSARVGWDRGVSTGWTDNPEAWQTALFANYKINRHLEVIGGLGVIYLAPGTIDKATPPTGFTASSGSGDILFTQVDMKVRFYRASAAL
jgi:long-chain fatty acid transport protein